MRQRKVFILSAPAACGKSTWIVKQMEPQTDVWISRDNIRFMLLQEGEDYFAHESKVKNIFFTAIRENTIISKKYDNVFIDATHLTPKARRQTLAYVAPGTYKIAVSFEVPAEVAIERNKQRTGRARVPESVILNMSAQFKTPRISEGFDEIWHIDAEGTITKEVKS